MWYLDLGGRIVRLLHKESGTNIINLLDPTENFYPVCGGYDEMTAWKWGGTGFANSYEAKSGWKKSDPSFKRNQMLLFHTMIQVFVLSARSPYRKTVRVYIFHPPL